MKDHRGYAKKLAKLLLQLQQRTQGESNHDSIQDAIDLCNDVAKRKASVTGLGVVHRMISDALPWESEFLAAWQTLRQEYEDSDTPSRAS